MVPGLAWKTIIIIKKNNTPEDKVPRYFNGLKNIRCFLIFQPLPQHHLLIIHLDVISHIFLLAPGPAQYRTNRGGDRCHPFRSSRSHLGRQMTLGLLQPWLKWDVYLTHSATAARYLTIRRLLRKILLV